MGYAIGSGLSQGGPAAADFVRPDGIEHLRTHSMWAGAFARTEDGLPGLDADGRVRRLGPHTACLLKAADELCVNALDQAERMAAGGAPDGAMRVRRVVVRFHVAGPVAGRLVVYNDGQGFPLDEATGVARDGARLYAPELAYSELFAGTNHGARRGRAAGTNGVGAKVAAASAALFRVRTTDLRPGVAPRTYEQEFRDRLRARGPAVLRPARPGESGTLVVVDPDYAALGYPQPPPPADLDEVAAWLRLRCEFLQTAAQGVAPGLVVEFDPGSARTGGEGMGAELDDGVPPSGRPCVCRSAADLARLLSASCRDAAVFPFEVHAAGAGGRWDCAAVVPDGRRGPGDAGVVNGCVSSAGAHVRAARALLEAAVGDAVADVIGRAPARRSRAKASAKAPAKTAGKAGAKAGAKAPKTAKADLGDAMAGVAVVVVCAIDGAEWDGQRKDVLHLARARLEGAALAGAGALVAALADRALRASGRPARAVEMYLPAARLGRAPCVLLLVEGKSALAGVKRGLGANARIAEERTKAGRRRPGAKPGASRSDVRPEGPNERGEQRGPEGLARMACGAQPVPSREEFGVFILGGVPMNAYRGLVEPPGGGRPVPTAQLRESQRTADLLAVLGLEWGRPPDALRYDTVVAFVDQDTDGAGKILSLVLGLLWRAWPELFAAGRVLQLKTPLARAYPSALRQGPPLAEFYTEAACHVWLAQYARTARLPPEAVAGGPGRARLPHIEYYKGIAAHNKAEICRIFEPARFWAAAHRFVSEPGAAEAAAFEAYLGEVSTERKRAVNGGVPDGERRAYDAAAAAGAVPCAAHLAVPCREFKVEAVARQLPSAVDGLAQAQRKVADWVLDGDRLRRPAKIFQVAGKVGADREYHHGEASLNNTIFGMAQAFVGGRAWPLLINEGEAGSRDEGGDDAGQPRYVSARVSPLARAAFPAAARACLRLADVDGRPAEPVFLCPCVPLALLDGCERVTEGWNHSSYPRALPGVLALARAAARGDAGVAAAAGALAAARDAGHGASRDGRPLPAEPAAAAALAALAARFPLEAHQGPFRGRFLRAPDGSCEIAVGCYAPAERTAGRGEAVRVTELPPRAATSDWVARLAARLGDDLAGPPVDRSGDERVDVEVPLAPGALARWAAVAVGPGQVDAAEAALGLDRALTPRLNYLGPDGAVLEFGTSYHAVAAAWFAAARPVYAARAERDLALAAARVAVLENQARFADQAAAQPGAGHAGMDFRRFADDAAADAALAAAGFARLDAAVAGRPGRRQAADIRRDLTAGARAGFAYLADMPGRELTAAARARRAARLDAARRELDAARRAAAESPAGSTTWLAEIDAFERAAFDYAANGAGAGASLDDLEEDHARDDHGGDDRGAGGPAE
jgi:hypothetical protein